MSEPTNQDIMNAILALNNKINYLSENAATKEDIQSVISGTETMIGSVIEEVKKQGDISKLNIDGAETRINSQFENQSKMTKKMLNILEDSINTSKKVASHDMRLENIEAEQFIMRRQLKDIKGG